MKPRSKQMRIDEDEENEDEHWSKKRVVNPLMDKLMTEMTFLAW